MKYLGLVLSFFLTFNVLAASGTVTELERHFDDFQYAMTVEWDQKDPAFQESKTNEFLDKMASLMQGQGLTKEEILTMAQKRMGNKEAFEALKFKLSALTKVNSAEELARVMRESSSDFYSRGASWNGDVATIGAGILIAIVVGYAIWFSANYKCVQYDQKYECKSESYCVGYDFNNDCTYWREDTTCGYVDYCSLYEKK